MLNEVSRSGGVDLTEHQKFYDQFLSQVFYYRHRAIQIVSEGEMQGLDNLEEIVGFNLGAIESYLTEKYLGMGFVESWKELYRKAEKINENISESVISNIFDYWFPGAFQKFKKVDI
jgi:hypothetical protein